jgi:hypothetical protein
MPTAAMTTLQLTDGSVTADLLDGTNYELNDSGWAPAVAPRSQSDIGPYYEDVEEKISVNVIGGTNMLANSAKLSQLLDQADAWFDGEPVAPVVIKAQPKGSTQSVSQALILGRASGQLLDLPSTYNDFLVGNSIENGGLRFRRRGQWLADEVAVTAGSSVNAAVIQSITSLANLKGVHPLTIELGSIPSGTSGATIDDLPASVLLYSYAANRLAIVEAESLMSPISGLGTTDASYSSVSESEARGTHVLQCAPVTGGAKATGYALTGLPDAIEQIYVYASVAGLTPGMSWTVRVKTINLGRVAYGPSVTIDGYTGGPVVVFLGAISNPVGHSAVALEITPSDASGSPAFQMDYLAFVAGESPCEGALAIDAVNDIATTLGGGINFSLVVQDRSLTDIDPFVGVTRTSPDIAINAGYRGNASLLSTGTTVSTLWLPSGNNVWLSHLINGTVTSTKLTVRRKPASVVPQ